MLLDSLSVVLILLRVEYVLGLVSAFSITEFLFLIIYGGFSREITGLLIAWEVIFYDVLNDTLVLENGRRLVQIVIGLADLHRVEINFAVCVWVAQQCIL